MYLLSMSNSDYMVMTFVFGLLAVISYWCRRKNVSSKDFLVLQSKSVNPLINSLSLASIGLPEFMLFSSLAACYGLPVICLFIPIFLLVSAIADYKINNSAVINDVINARSSSINQRTFYVFYGLFLILISGVTISITVGLLKSLLGWEFGNTALSLMAVVGVCLLLGGVLSVILSQFFVTLITLVILSTIIYLAYQFIGFGNLIDNLHSVATTNGLSVTAFTKPVSNMNSLHGIIFLLFTVMLLITIYPISVIKQNKLVNNKRRVSLLSRFLQLGLLLLVMFIGIFALATPNSTQNISGSKIITQQTKLNDGSMGFIVKAVPDNNPVVMQKGIIPQNMNIDDNFTSKYSDSETSAQGFDYLSSALVLIKHSLPYAFVALTIVILLFYKTMSESLLAMTLLTINGFYAPYYNQSNEEYENLWATRVFLFMYLFVVVSLGLVFYKFFDLYYLCGVSLLFGIIVFMQLMGVRLNLFANILVNLLCLFGVLFTNIVNIPSLYPLIKFPSWDVFIICWGTLVLVVSLVCSLICKVMRN